MEMDQNQCIKYGKEIIEQYDKLLYEFKKLNNICENKIKADWQGTDSDAFYNLYKQNIEERFKSTLNKIQDLGNFIQVSANAYEMLDENYKEKIEGM